MSDIEKISSAGNIARVRAISNGGQRLHVVYRNGQAATIDLISALEVKAGAVIIVRSEPSSIEIAPNDLWPEESEAGVVRLKLPDVTVIDGNGRWVMVPTREGATYREGHTVEFRDSIGVLRTLCEEPLKYVDLPVIDEITIDKFKVGRAAEGDSFEDFGGSEHVIERARELIELPLTHKAALSAIGARPIKGVLFSGPPGSGKTMLARIVANATDAVFYKISGPEIFSKWYGQSEEILRRIFQDAAKQAKAIIFFDEIDSVAAQRGDESHEASRRIVAQLLTLMDGFTSDSNIIVIAATNRPQDIDRALMRPGRFDWEVKFSLPDRSERVQILKASSRRLKTREPLPHERVAEETESWSAADLAAIWSEAALLAVKDQRKVIIAQDYLGGLRRVATQRAQVRRANE